ncbi:MAG: VWA domain-containing protein [Vicinamibacterales bacterium]
MRPSAVVALVLAALTAPLTAQDPERTFRAGVDIVSLSVTVTDPASRYIVDLEQKDFSVFEDGVKQDLTFFNRKQQPLALSLLLDSSASMEGRMATLQAAAANFVRRLQPGDLAQVVDFDSRVEIRQRFTNRQEELEAAIRQTAAGGSTSLHNAIYIALKELKKTQAKTDEEVRRQALIVFSDGEDTSSLVSFDEVLDLAKRSETAIYTISLQSDTPSASQQRGFQEADFVMKQLALETGGRSFAAKRVEDLSGVYAEIANELASQYVLGYTSKNQIRNGAWRRIVVQVARADAIPRTKKGYFAAAGK